MTSTNRWLPGAFAAAVCTILVLAGCGAVSGSPSSPSRAGTRVSSNAASTIALPSPSRTNPTPPLLAHDAADHTVLFSSSGTPTATFPSNALYRVLSPLGDRLLAAHMGGAKGTDGLTAISASGSTQVLEHFPTTVEFVDAIG